MGSKTVTQEKAMPKFQEDFLKNTVIPFAEDFLGTPYESYEGERVAGLTDLQKSALSGFGSLDAGGDLYKAASDIYGDLGEFEAPELDGITIGDVGSIADADMAKYMSPYTQEVIDRGMDDIYRAQQKGMGQLGAAATKAGAFGGSRQGVAEGVAAGEYGRLFGDFAAQQREKAYTQAMGLATGDINRAQQRALTQAGLDLKTGLANQAALFDAARLRGQAASGLGATAGANLQSQLAALGAQMSAGEVERGLSQANLDAGFQDYLARLQYPLTQFGVLTGAAGAVPQGYGTTTEKTRDPMGNFANILSAAGSFGQGFPMIFGGSDIAFKDNIQKIGEIDDVTFYKWDWNETAKISNVDHAPSVGVIAQELEQTYPEFVVKGEDGFRYVNYGALYNKLGV